MAAIAGSTLSRHQRAGPYHNAACGSPLAAPAAPLGSSSARPLPQWLKRARTGVLGSPRAGLSFLVLAGRRRGERSRCDVPKRRLGRRAGQPFAVPQSRQVTGLIHGRPAHWPSGAGRHSSLNQGPLSTVTPEL